MPSEFDLIVDELHFRCRFTTVENTKPVLALEVLAQLVWELQTRLEVVEHKIRENEQAKLKSYANQIRAIGGNPNEYLDCNSPSRDDDQGASVTT